MKAYRRIENEIVREDECDFTGGDSIEALVKFARHNIERNRATYFEVSLFGDVLYALKRAQTEADLKAVDTAAEVIVNQLVSAGVTQFHILYTSGKDTRGKILRVSTNMHIHVGSTDEFYPFGVAIMAMLYGHKLLVVIPKIA